MARRLFRKKRPQQSRSLAILLIAVLCLGVGYALWFTDSTRQRETAQISAPVATDAGQPIKLPSGFGDAFIDRPAMRLGSSVESDRRGEDSAAANPVTGPGVALEPAQQPETAIPRRDASRQEPAAETVGSASTPAAPPPPASGSTSAERHGEPRGSARTAPSAGPESRAADLAIEPAAGPIAPPPAQPVEPTATASLTQAPEAMPSPEQTQPTETTEPVPRPVPRARQALPKLESEEPIDARSPVPPPSSRDDPLAIVAAPLRPVVVPPSVDEEPLIAERDSPTGPLETDVDLPPATSRNVARSLVAADVRNREPVNTVGASVNLREIDRGQLHYFTEVTGLMGRKVEHRWIYRGRVEGTMRFQVGSNRWRASSRKTILPHQKGEWRVVVVDDAGRTLGGSRFVVE
jgi:hypothetical protein